MVIIITGATSGIGRVSAEYLAKLGHTVYSFSRRVLTDTNIKYVYCDVSDIESIKKAVNQVVLNEGKIDCLVNNAGFGISGSFENNTIQSIEKIIDVNIKGCLFMAKETLPHLRKSRGRIINISSVAGLLPIPFQTVYSLSKASLVAFSKGLANEVRPFNVKVSCILPGDIKTEFTDNRIKEKESEIYSPRVERSVKKMEKDEKNGMNPLKISKKIAKIIKSSRPPLVTTVGFKYKFFLFLNRILPTRLVNFVLYKMYGK